MADRIRRQIPEATVARLPRLPAQPARGPRRRTSPPISSERLAEMAGVNAAKVRKDLSYLGSYGTRGVGYDVEYLLFQMSRELGLTQDWPVVIVGVGNLGPGPRQLRRVRRAGLPGRRPRRRRPARWSARRCTASSCATSTTCRRSPPSASIAIGIIATPGGAAQDVADRLVAAGRAVDPQLRPGGDLGARGRLAAQGRPRRRAADPELLPAAPGRRSAGRPPLAG